MNRLWLGAVCGSVALMMAGIPGGAEADDAAAEVPGPAPAVDFERQIRPLLSNRCFQCHGPDAATRQAELRLDSRADVFGESGRAAVIVPGDAEASELFQRVSADDPDVRMPPADSKLPPLTSDEVALVRRWIDSGASWKQHWAFVTPNRPEPPDVKGSAWPLNAIDAFTLAAMRAHGLEPTGEAPRETLIRRVTYDLTGLPPTPQEVDDFLADASAEAYERVVDRLLRSPRYGEHMTRYWLDAARYGDTHGLHLDNARSLWPYRDWLIDAFNSNMPFDQMVIEQLAGDLLPEASVMQRVATGFNRCNVTTSEGGSIDEEYYVRYAVDRVETMSTVFMGLTVGCAVCHDHKFDPVTQQDFYGLFAFFNSFNEKPMDGNALLPPPFLEIPSDEQRARREALTAELADVNREVDESLAAVTYTDPHADAESLPEQPSDTASAAPGDQSFESQRLWELSAREGQNLPGPVREALKVAPAERSDEQAALLRRHFLEFVHAPTRETLAQLHARRQAVEAELKQINDAIPKTMVSEELPEPKPAYVLTRGEYDKKAEQVERAVPAVLPPLPAEAPRNRLGLAQWLVDPSHPLTARVTMNRWWQRYFGTGLVKTAEDFGIQGEPPSHPELLDWLAVEFRESGWDVKHMQKLIVMSATYRQASQITPDRLVKDPYNRWLSRGPRFRMDAEMIRDTALFVSGLLNPQIGGPSVKPYQPPGLWEAVGYTSSNTAKFQQDAGDKLYRRSMYTFWKRTSHPPAMAVFDAPSRESCTVRRPRTNTPLQALTLMNDRQFVEAARHFARRLLEEGGASDAERLAFGFRCVTARAPSESELRVLVEALARQRAEFTADPGAASALIDSATTQPQPTHTDRDRAQDPELAAWTMIANLLFNLDETVTKG